jgi:glycosyltransferase involved in cell wall biosynthesis
MNIGIDLRGLNYSINTGVNSYTLHFLHCLYEVKKQRNNLQITAIGLDKKVFKQLFLDYPFIINLIDHNLSYSDYLNQFIITNRSFLNILALLKLKITGNFRFFAKQFDIIFLPQPKPFLFNPKTQVITIFHDIFGVIDDSTMTWKQKLIENKRVYKALAKGSKAIFANSFSTALDLQKILEIDQDKIKLVYPALPILKTKSKNSSKLHLPKKYMLAISGIEPRKNWLNIIKAYELLRINGIAGDYRLVLAGRVVNQKYYTSLLKYITKNRIKNVEFILDIDDTNKKVLLKNTSFVLYPSYYEGFGFPILEAFEHGKVVITSKISSMPELARGGAVYINPLNFLEIYNAMQILIEDPEFKAKLNQNITKIKQKYTWTELQNALESVL